MKKVIRKFVVLINKMLSKYSIGICRYCKFTSRELEFANVGVDLIRISTLELMALELKENCMDKDAAVAELGVFRGEFAQHINRYFPDKKLYLFDTFEGFDSRDINVDANNLFSRGNQDFSNTSVQLVLDKMKHKENCIVRKGFFPETSKELNTTFCFVSIDADLYQPIYDGLEYFYPRLCAGGGIMIHDYNNTHYQGAKAAVKEFCMKYHVGYVCLADAGGTAVITKSF